MVTDPLQDSGDVVLQEDEEFGQKAEWIGGAIADGGERVHGEPEDARVFGPAKEQLAVWARRVVGVRRVLEMPRVIVKV